jgi:archaellum component FlaC
VNQLKSTMSQEVNQLKSTMSQEVNQLKSTMSQEVNQLKSTNAQLTQEVADLRKQLGKFQKIRTIYINCTNTSTSRGKNNTFTLSFFKLFR